MHPGNLMPAGRAVWWRAGRATGTCRGAALCGATRTHWSVFALADPGHELTGFFRFAFRADGVGFLAEAQRDHFKLFLAFIAWIFINRHSLDPLDVVASIYGLKSEKSIPGKQFALKLSIDRPGPYSYTARQVKRVFIRQSSALWKGSYEGKE